MTLRELFLLNLVAGVLLPCGVCPCIKTPGYRRAPLRLGSIARHRWGQYVDVLENLGKLTVSEMDREEMDLICFADPDRKIFCN